MKKCLYLTAAIVIAASPVLAAGFDQALKFLRPADLPTATDTTESGDYVYYYDADEQNVVKRDATDILLGDDLTVTDAITAADVTSTDDVVVGDDIDVAGDLRVGNGTPSVSQNGEDTYLEGTFEVDGASEFDGAVDFDAAIVIDTTTIAENAVKYAARGSFTVCGDITTVNNNTVYYGPSQVVIDSATAGGVTCNTDATGNTTEATADEIPVAGVAWVPLGMTCWSTDMGATGSPLTYTLRVAAAAYDAGAITTSIADNILSGSSPANTIGATEVAANSTVSVALTSAGDVGAGAFVCRVNYAY